MLKAEKKRPQGGFARARSRSRKGGARFYSVESGTSRDLLALAYRRRSGQLLQKAST